MEIFEEMEEKFVETNGIKLHTIIIGSGEPLMLLHGFPDCWYGWKDIILGLKDKYKLVVPDTRGINLSDRPEGVENYTVEILVEDIKALSETLKLGKFSLAGHDWGGIIASVFAEKYPELLKNLILTNGPHLVHFKKCIRTDKSQQKASSYMKMFVKPEAEKMFLQKNMQLLKVALLESPKRKIPLSEFDRKVYIDAWSQPGAINAGLNYYRTTFVEFPEVETNWTGIINVPTLVIHGMKDNAITLVTIEGLSEYIKDLKIVKVENTTHWVMAEKPEIVISNIKEFIG